MVSLAAYAASLAALLSAVNAGFYTTYPVGADAVNPGQTISIRWRPDASAPDLSTVTKYTLKFMTGGNIVQTTVRTIGEFDIATTTIPFTIPQTAPGMYFLMYTASNGAGSSWSTRFSVGGGTTWYPVGVATGVDPGTSNTDIGTPIGTTASSSSAPSTAATTTSPSNPVTSNTADQTSVGGSSSTATSTTSPAGPNTSIEERTQSSAGGTSPVPSSSGPVPQTSTTPTLDTSDPVSPPTNPGNSDQTTDTGVPKTSSSLTGSSSNGSSSESESSESSSDSTTSNNAAAARYLSAAALVVAAAFAW
ncbi:hypothetical protein IWW37_004042 [Coemansia sp. RSA 2050]|nr:hypothetical protein IWW37_004042 [Coemansia sp. RSA 2050]KAJ2731992.1 hypothetical protein IW152_004145 [Coemansia sp. BCRC 34962]